VNLNGLPAVKFEACGAFVNNYDTMRLQNSRFIWPSNSNVLPFSRHSEEMRLRYLRLIVMQCANINKFSGAFVLAAAIMANGPLTAAPSEAAPLEVGIWYDDTGRGAVKIDICGDTLCGKIVWLKDPLNAQGEPLTDKHNPEPSMRNRFICGLPILGNLHQMSDGGFDNGWVYDPKVGKSYTVALQLLDENTLKVTGYAGLKFFGKSFIWTRAPDDLPACSTDTAFDPDGKTAAAPPAKARTRQPAR
jgi:uncharacterized protein (DUF2147 family)